MNILLINGSPRAKRSNSRKLALSFIEGMRGVAEGRGEEVQLDEVNVATADIAPCRGCFACWKSETGTCCIHDEMASVIEKTLAADVVVWSFPLYFFNVPGPLKNLIDRRLPMALPFMTETRDGYGSGSHPARYDTSRTRNVLISCCGFFSAEGNYDSVRMMFDHTLGRGNYETIFCGQGELFSVKELSERTDAYLAVVRRAGEEYAAGAIGDATRAQLGQLLYPKEIFEAMADASWGVSKETGAKEPEDLVFTRQMAALYNKAAYDGKDRVLEMNYTDLGSSYQILLGKDGAQVVTDGSLEATTRINTPFEVWAKISRGELGGAQALGDRLYTVDGDFSLMIDWDRYFGGLGGSAGRNPSVAEGKRLGRPSMVTMLIPWVCLWVAVSINASIGAVITLGVCAFVPVILHRRQFVRWDWLSLAVVTVLSLFTAFTGQGDVAVVVGYVTFGLMWLYSCAVREPLCATYVKYDYGGDSALDNPLFYKTNHILALCWGILYLLTGVWTLLLKQAGIGNIVVIINNLVPVAMGIFTGWFQRWYPAHLAAGGGRE